MPTLSDRMDFEHVIRVDEHREVTDADGVWAPEVYLDEDSDTIDGLGDWSLMDGYSGQDRYHGPIMHASELIGGQLAADIVATPGFYVAVTVECIDDPEHPAGWAIARKDLS